MTQVKIDYNGITHLSCRALAYTLLGTTNQELLSNSIARKIDHNIRNSKPWYDGLEHHDKYFNYHIQDIDTPIEFLGGKYETRASFIKFLTKEYKRSYRYINSLIDMYMNEGLILTDALDHMLYKLLCSVGAEQDYSSQRIPNRDQVAPTLSTSYTA